MRMEKSDLLDRLAALTGDLRPLPGQSLKQLEQARLAVAHAIAAGQSEPLSTRPSLQPVAIETEELRGIDSAISRLVTHPPPQEFLVARRDLPVAVTGFPTLGPQWAVGREIDSSLGPFVDGTGRMVWIDLFKVVVQTSLVRFAGAAPFVTLPLSIISVGGDHYTLSAGSVWIASQLLAPGAPAGGYTGLRIKGGSVTFSHPLTASGKEIVVPPGVTCTVALELDTPPVPAASGPGEDARRAVVSVPTTVTFVFSATGASIASVAKARLAAYGSTIDLEPTTITPFYKADAGRIFVPFKASTASFSVTDVRSDLLVPAGDTTIETAAWTLPVALISPASLGDALGAGGLALMLAESLDLTWKGQTDSVPAGPMTLFADPGLLLLSASTVKAGGTDSVSLWSESPGKEPTAKIDLKWVAPFPLLYLSEASGAEILDLVGSISGNFDRPVTVAGNRVWAHSANAQILFIESPLFTGVFIEASLDPPPPPTKALAFAIANAVFRTTPALKLQLAAQYDGATSKNGVLALSFGLQFLLPTLPDPYAANVVLPVGRGNDFGISGPLVAQVVWAPAKAPVLSYTLPTDPALVGNTAVAGRQEANVAFLSGREGGPFILLDLSTNVDQFGVGWISTPRAAGAGSAFSVDSMYLAAQSRSVYVLTVPAVQWEAVFTETQLPPPSPPFPSPVTFADHGGPSAISVQSVQLVRVAPAPALDALVASFADSSTPVAASGRFTLPFGIEASCTLSKPDAGGRGATVGYNRPDFTTEAVKGGYQITIRAIAPEGAGSPSLAGWTLQRKDNLLFSGVPVANRSVLDTDVDTIFNSYLGPGSPTAQVPVTRIDLSGYGESLFSHWTNPAGDAVAVSQARFDVLLGRTSLEVVQVRSILYPYAVRVVRTITIQRKNSGSVVRRDSGWQAVSDGEYLYPGAALTTHPGVVKKIRNVTNIRDTGQIIPLSGGAEAAAVIFDGDLLIENAVKGAGAAGVPARGQLGYVQLTPTGGSMWTPSQYAELIAKAGPLGGSVDCIVDIGASGQLMKVGRVGVGVTQGMGGAEFVMTAWGSPRFPQGGQWSFLRQTGPGTAPEVVDKDLGVPLIRAGAAPAPPPASSPYRFADPVDLATPLSPLSDYGIVHATGAQRVFFPRPKIEGSADRITSTRPPVLADPYSLANSVGYFPRVDAALPFPDASYALVISGGNYRLELPAPTFPITVGQRTIAEANKVRSFVDYSAATATVVIDTAAPVAWSFELKNAAAAMSSASMGEMMRYVGDFKADADHPLILANARVIFGGALGVVQDVMKFLQELGFPMPMAVSMTNSPELKIMLKIPLDEELNKLLPPCGPHFEDTDVTVGYTIDLKGGDVGAEFELGAAVFIPTPFCTCVAQPPPEPPQISGLQAVGLINFDAKIDTQFGQAFTLTLGAGIGVSFRLADAFKVVAYYVETEFLIFGDVFGLGVGALLKGSIDLEVISVDVSLEAKMAVLKVDASSTCSDVTVWAVAQVTFAVEVTIAFVIDIDFEVQAEWSRNLNGGPCVLPDVL